MYPEAGGSSSFARRAFNEFWSFFAAWGQMLNYIITVAISAFFVPHYLGVFWAPLRRVARRHRRRHRRGGRARRAEHRRRQGVGRAERLPRARRLLHAGAARGRRPGAGLLAATRWSTTSTSDLRRRCRDFLIAIPVGMVAYTGIETISNMAEEARDYGKTIPRAIGGVVVARVRDLRVPAGGRAVGDAGRERHDAAGAAQGRRAATPTTRCSASSRTSTWAALQHAAEIYVGILAATILFIATNAGMIGVSRLTYSMGQYRQLPERLRVLHPKFRTPYVAIIAVRAGRVRDDHPGPGRLPRARSTRSARCCRSRSRTWR